MRIKLQNTGRQASSVFQPVHCTAFWSKWTYSSWRQIHSVLRLSWQINTKLLVVWVLFLVWGYGVIFAQKHVLQLLGILLLWGYKTTNWSSVCDILYAVVWKRNSDVYIDVSDVSRQTKLDLLLQSVQSAGNISLWCDVLFICPASQIKASPNKDRGHSTWNRE